MAYGRVVDGRGKPVQGAEITVAEMADDDNSSLIVGPTVAYSPVGPDIITSDMQGRFEAAGLGAGEYLFRASHPEWASTRLMEVAVPEGARRIDLSNLVLQAPARIEGTVVSQGEPQPSTVVWLHSQGKRGLQAVTEADGGFLFEGLTPGRTLLRTSNVDSVVERRIDLPDGGLERVTLELVPKAVLELGIAGTAPDKSYRVWLRRSQQPGDPAVSGLRSAAISQSAGGAANIILTAGAPARYTLMIFKSKARKKSCSVLLLNIQSPFFDTEVSLHSGRQKFSVDLPDH